MRFNEKILKQLLIVVPLALAIFIVSFVLVGNTRTEYRILYEEQPLVFVTRTGACYHSYGCRHLSQSRIPKGLYQAEESGYRCCSVCDGIGYGTMQVEIRVPYEVEDYSPAILFGIFSVIFITPSLYAPISGLLDRLHYYEKEGEEEI